MIIGLGSDITNISRFERSLQAYGTKLLQRILGPAEQQELSALKNVSPQEYAAFIAKRFAAKEAVYKALPFGEVDFKKITVHNGPDGEPRINIDDERCAGLRFFISLSHTQNYAVATAVVENARD